MDTPNSRELEVVRALKPRAYDAFTQYGTVSGIGITTDPNGKYGLKINFSALHTRQEELPAVWEGVPVAVEMTGRIVKR